MRWGLLGLALIVLAGAGERAAQGATLRWKFKAGESLHYTMDQKTLTRANLPGGQEIKTTLSQTIDMTWSVKSVDDRGVASLTQTIDRIRDQVEAPVGSYTFDSKDPKDPEGLIAASRIPLFKALLGTPIAFTLNPRGEPGAIRVPDALTKAIGELGPAAAGAGAIFSEEGLKEMLSQSSLILPDTDLSVGQTWTRQTKNAVPPLGTVVIDATYRFDGPVPNAGPDAVKIGLATKVDIQPAAAEPNASANGLKIRSQKSQGGYTFDANAGRILDSTLTDLLEVGASIKVGLGPGAKEMELTQSTETTTTRKLIKDEKARPGN